MPSEKSKITPEISPPLSRLHHSRHPEDRPWAISPDGCRLILPGSIDHARRTLGRTGQKLARGWDDVTIIPYHPDLNPAPIPSKTIIVPIPAYLWTPELIATLSQKRDTKIHRLKRMSVPGRVKSGLSNLQKGLLTGKAEKLLRGAKIHYVEWATVIMCSGAHSGCKSNPMMGTLRCHGSLVLDENAKFPQREVEYHTDDGRECIVCVAGGPHSVSAFVRKGRAVGHECFPMGSPEGEGKGKCLVTDLMGLRLMFCGGREGIVGDLEQGSMSVREISESNSSIESEDQRSNETTASCGLFDKISTCPADAEMSFQEVLDWNGNYQVTRHGTLAGAVVSHESMQADLNSMLANRHLATNDCDTEVWTSIFAFIWMAIWSIIPVVSRRKFGYMRDHIRWLKWALPGHLRILPAFVAILCGGCIAFSVTGASFEVAAQSAMWWSAIGLIGLTLATYSIGNLILLTFYATTAARLALDKTTMDEVLHARSVRVISWLGVFTMVKVHNTGLASALFAAAVLALGVLSTQIFEVDSVEEVGKVTIRAAPLALVLGAGYGTALILTLWLASSIRLLCLSNGGARRALYILEDDLALVNAIASSPLEDILQGMSDATPAELRAALGPRWVQYGASKKIMPTPSMTILNSDVGMMDPADGMDALATRDVGHLVLDLEDRVGRAEHGMYA